MCKISTLHSHICSHPHIYVNFDSDLNLCNSCKHKIFSPIIHDERMRYARTRPHHVLCLYTSHLMVFIHILLLFCFINHIYKNCIPCRWRLCHSLGLDIYTINLMTLQEQRSKFGALAHIEEWKATLRQGSVWTFHIRWIHLIPHDKNRIYTQYVDAIIEQITWKSIGKSVFCLKILHV